MSAPTTAPKSAAVYSLAVGMQRLDSEMMDLLDELHDSDDPAWTTAELADMLDTSRRSAQRVGERLFRAGELETKNPGGRSRVWWLPGTRKPPRGDERARALGDGQASLGGLDDGPDRPDLSDLADDGADDSAGADDLAPYLDALEGWEPGRSDDEREQKRELGAEVLQWLAGRDEPAQKADVLDAFADTIDERDMAESTFWTEYGRPALNEAVDAGAVEKPGRWSYEWAGGE